MDRLCGRQPRKSLQGREVRMSSPCVLLLRAGPPTPPDRLPEARIPSPCHLGPLWFQATSERESINPEQAELVFQQLRGERTQPIHVGRPWRKVRVRRRATARRARIDRTSHGKLLRGDEPHAQKMIQKADCAPVGTVRFERLLRLGSWFFSNSNSAKT